MPTSRLESMISTRLGLIGVAGKMAGSTMRKVMALFSISICLDISD